jgi:integrase/recombinase XerD
VHDSTPRRQLWKVSPEWYNSPASLWGMQMNEAIREYLEYLRNVKGRSENTILAYKRDLDQFAAIVKQVDRTAEPEIIPVPSIEYYLERLMTKNYKSSTVARKCAAVRGFIEYWHSDEILPLNCIENQLKDLEPTQRRPHVLTNEQIIELVKSPMELNSPLALRDTAILSLMYETGLRATDIIQLSVEDLDLPGKCIQAEPFGRVGIPLNESATHLEEYLTEGRPHLARIPEERSLFLNQRGKGLTRQGVWFIVRRWANEAQIDETISPNTIRHSLIQHLIDSGLSKREILRRLGLRSPNSLRSFKVSQNKVGEE